MILQTVPAKLEGQIELSSSKSNLIRLIIIASLVNKKTTINYSCKLARDTLVVIHNLQQAGIEIKIKQTKIIITGDSFLNNNEVFDCLDSGAAFRFLIPLFLLKFKSFSLTGTAKLIERVLVSSKDYFSENQIVFHRTNDIVKFNGTIEPRTYYLSLDKTSQNANGLLMVLPFVKGEGAKLSIVGDASKQYINYTIYLMSLFGITTTVNGNLYTFTTTFANDDIVIDAESDLSALPFYLFLSYRYYILVKPFLYSLFSPDYIFFRILSQLGLNTYYKNNCLVINNKQNVIQNQTIDFLDCPDLVLPVLGFAIYLNINITFTNVQNLQYKESNRLDFIYMLLNTINQNYTTTDHNGQISLTIYQTKNQNLNNLTLDCFNDHRIIMTCIMLSFLTNKPFSLINANGTEKSDANFLNNYKKLGACFRWQKK